MSAPRSTRIARLAAWVASTLVLMVALSGCGGAASDAEPTDAATRVVTDAEGNEVTVPASPKRVVTLSEPALDGVLALGVQPVGATAGRGQPGVPSYLADLAGDPPIVGTVGQPNYEEIKAVDPDLILVDGTSVTNNQNVIDLLGQIAPTVNTGYAGGDWRANFGRVADALDLVDQGKQVIADYDAHVAAVHDQLGDRLEDTYSIVRWQDSGPGLILKELPAGVALTDLGLQRPPGQDKEGRGHSEPVSLENLVDIDADWMFFGTLGGASVGSPGGGDGESGLDSAQAALDQAVTVPGFTQLNAYQQDHVILVDGAVWTTTGGPLLMNHIVDDVEKALVD